MDTLPRRSSGGTCGEGAMPYAGTGTAGLGRWSPCGEGRTDGGAGGAGGAPGGGGGAGGASRDSFTSGAGGAGARGEVWIIAIG